MGTSSGTIFQPQMLPEPRTEGLQTPVSVVSADAGKPALNSDDSPTESASSRETLSDHKSRSEAAATGVGVADLSSAGNRAFEKGRDAGEEAVVRRLGNCDRISLRDVAREPVDALADRLKRMPEELLEDLKAELRSILEVSCGPQQRDEFLVLQKLVHGRSDLTANSLSRAHRLQLEIFVAINTGIQAFLHPNICLPHSALVDVFTFRRCRNIACQNSLPVENCECRICITRNGFCNVCMCVICSKFDFEVNTCRWIGCDSCSHWTHTDCAIRAGLIGMGACRKGSAAGSPEMLFRCQACSRTSELLGWVKDVFQHCAPGWDHEALMKELETVGQIFRGSEDQRGLKLLWECEDLMGKLKNGVAESAVCKVLLLFFEDLEMEAVKRSEAEEAGRLVSPQDVCVKISEVVQEAVKKMEVVVEEKKHAYNKARIALEACDREIEDKKREMKELQMEQQWKKQQVEELETIIRLKQAEADMFQIKATEARREAEMLQRVMSAKSEKREEEYSSNYLKQRLDEAEAEKRCLFERIRLLESSTLSGGGDSSQMLMLSKVQDSHKTANNVPTRKGEGQNSVSADHQTLGSVP